MKIAPHANLPKTSALATSILIRSLLGGLVAATACGAVSEAASAPASSKMDAKADSKVESKADPKTDIKTDIKTGTKISLNPDSKVMATNDYANLHMRALDLAISGNTTSALQILHNLETEKLPAGEKDRLTLSIARIKYQQGDLKGALEQYKKINAGTEAWFTALEERAWTHMKLDQPAEALSQLKTLLTPLFKDKVSSEAFFLSGLAHLRICDYPALFKDLDTFKDRFRERVKTWQSSSDDQSAKQLKQVQDSIQKLNVVEAEAIQRLYMDNDALKKMKGKPGKIARGKNELSFPVSDDNNEVWLDEVDNYHVRLNGCPSNIAGSGTSKTPSVSVADTTKPVQATHK